MTSVYGVTFVGAREQIQNRLRERGTVPEDAQYMVASYAARVSRTEGAEDERQLAHALATPKPTLH